jgi:hypothetical protein
MIGLISDSDLTEDIRYNDHRDNFDLPEEFVPYASNAGCVEEFSSCNREALKESFLSIKDSCKIILEIGVHRNQDDSSTSVFLKNKNDDTYYFGVDIVDKSYLNNPDKRIHTIQSSSQNFLNVMFSIQKITGIRLNEVVIDYLFIDGWHSINQVLMDWEYTRAVRDGIVGFHDVNYHPGPKKFIEKLNTDRFTIDKQCPLDFGIAFIRRK